MGSGKRKAVSGKRKAGSGKREEGRSKKEEGRGKRKAGSSERDTEYTIREMGEIAGKGVRYKNVLTHFT